MPSLYVTPSRVDDRLFIRVAVGQTTTSAENVDQVWEVVEHELAKASSA
jgi:hypothetical protein